jgi:hypothetical protein
MQVRSLMQYSEQDNVNLEVFLNEIVHEFTLLIPGGAHLGDKLIIVMPSVNAPITYAHLLPNQYIIGITPTSLLYDQIAYQFAHELCHVYFDPRITNWLIESFCECMSLIILERLFRKWQVKASVDRREWYASNYAIYLATTNSVYLKSLNLTFEQAITFDIKDKIKELTTPYDRNLNFITAIKILNIYQSNPLVLELISILHYSLNANTLEQNQFVQEIHPNIDSITQNSPSELKERRMKLKEHLLI